MSERSSSGGPATFLVERYWPGITEAAFRATHERLRTSAEALRREGIEVAHLRSALAQDDEVVFFFRASSMAEVAEANRRGGVPFDRIVPVVEVE
ncbi:MAG TPA: nickel-binding protein [Candidatus Binatia bacterium]|nr:nickel-binding protein [Candidatus Binatia bacterium]